MLSKEFWERYMLLHAVGVTSLQPYRELNDFVCSRLPTGEAIKLVDAGCGVGTLIGQINKILAQGSSLLGLDWLELPLAFARKLNRDPRVRFTVSDLDQRWNTETDSADVVTMINVLYALKEPKRALEEMYRVVKSGGVVHIVNPYLPNPEPIFAQHDHWLKTQASGQEKQEDEQLRWARNEIETANKLIAEAAKGSGAHFFSLPELEQLVKQTGFVIDERRDSVYAGTCVYVRAHRL